MRIALYSVIIFVVSILVFVMYIQSTHEEVIELGKYFPDNIQVPEDSKYYQISAPSLGDSTYKSLGSGRVLVILCPDRKNTVVRFRTNHNWEFVSNLFEHSLPFSYSMIDYGNGLVTYRNENANYGYRLQQYDWGYEIGCNERLNTD
jgi:hypothetical protein